MKKSERSLLERQSQLLQRSALLRDRWGRQALALAPPLALADHVVGGWRWLRSHPELPAAALLLSVAVRPRRLWRWGLRAVWTWRLWRRARPWLRPWMRAAGRLWGG